LSGRAARDEEQKEMDEVRIEWPDAGSWVPGEIWHRHANGEIAMTPRTEVDAEGVRTVTFRCDECNAEVLSVRFPQATARA
jgi:hypothetical protein